MTSPYYTSLFSPSEGRKAVPQPCSSLRASWMSSPSSPSRDVTSAGTLSEKFTLSPDPSSWGSTNILPPGTPGYVRDFDDDLHELDLDHDTIMNQSCNIFSARGLANLGCLATLTTAVLGLFLGYPLATYFTKKTAELVLDSSAENIATITTGRWSLVDEDTPEWALTRKSFNDETGEDVDYTLVFSDEFNVDGRSFYPGDDPFWEAVDLHYWQTNNLEWYDPAAITTKDGALEITLSKKSTHGLDYQGGMLTTWNKFCFTGGIFEAALTLPGAVGVRGLWPSLWTMGNLGRAGYGASLEGTWPYSYDTCDVGTMANQTKDGLPLTATSDGDPYNNDVLSFLPGQRLSRCTCSGESHPGPMHSDGTYVGRSAPEIDMFEAKVEGDPLIGTVSQSAQMGPFNYGYYWLNSTENYDITNSTVTELNSYIGGAYQQSISAISTANQSCFELTDGCYAVYAIEYKPGFDDAYISWINNNKTAWTLKSGALGADTRVEIGPRAVTQEPMYLIGNLGISENFGTVDFDTLTFPTTLRVDYVRVYQRSDSINLGCDPEDFPTAAYIEKYQEAYTNPNLTTWRNDYGQPFPNNSFAGEC